jgi:hypothetical protein
MTRTLTAKEIKEVTAGVSKRLYVYGVIYYN